MLSTAKRVSRGDRRNGERGAIAIMMFLMLTVLMGFAAVGFDLSYVRLARLEMKNASDAAAHAAVLRLRKTNDTDKARTAALTVAAQNTILGKSLTLQDNDVEFGYWDQSKGKFTASAPYTAVRIKGVRQSSASNDGYIELTFGRVLGWQQSSITEDTIGAFSNRNFMIELDITPSYVCQIDEAARSSLTLLDLIYAKKIAGDRISLDVFAGESKELTEFMNVQDKHDDIYKAWTGESLLYKSFLPGTRTKGITVCHKLDPDDPTKSLTTSVGPCAGITYDYPNNPNTIACYTGGRTGYATKLYAGTDIAHAIRAGTAKLKAKTQDYEPRILIVVTDGSPMACTAPGGGKLCNEVAPPCCADGFCNKKNASDSGVPERIDACNAAHDILDDAKKAADEAFAEKIELFTVKITGALGDNSDLFTKSLARGKHGFGQWINDATQLDDAFAKVLGQVPVSLVK